MRKSWIALLAVVTLVAFAVPAMAEVNLNGFIRIKPYMTGNYQTSTTAGALVEGNGAGYLRPVPDADQSYTAAFVDQRARLKFTVGDENVKAVAFFEIDSIWGDKAYGGGARNSGGGLEADSTNLETKNVYIWFKVPNTSLDVTAGIQGQSDSYAGTFMGYADIAGIFVTGKFEPVGFRFAFAKPWEASVRNTDDVNLWIAEAKIAPTKDVKVGVNVYYLDDTSGGINTTANAGFLNWAATVPPEIPSGYRSLRIWMPGVDFSAGLGPVTLSGFAFYQSGKAKYLTGADSKVKGFAADLRADMTVPGAGGKLFVEGIYVPGDDNRADRDFKSVVTLNNYNLSGAFFSRADMYLLFPNIDDIQQEDGNLCYDVSNGGAGVMFIGAGYSQKIVDKLAFKVGAGYMKAAKKRQRDIAIFSDTYNFRNNSAMGTEVNANVSYNVSKGLDFGLYGAYVFLGAAYEPTGGGSKANNPWETHARLQYAF